MSAAPLAREPHADSAAGASYEAASGYAATAHYGGARSYAAAPDAPRPGHRETPATAPAPRIHLVRTPLSPRSRIPFVLLCMTLIGGALVGVLLFNTTMARGAYEERELQAQIVQLAQNEQALLAELDAKASPTELAKRARKLGMVQDATPAFIRLKDGKIVGDPTPAKKPEKPASAKK